MASVYNQVTGEWEEKEDTGPNAFSTQGATAMGPGLSGLYQQQDTSSLPFGGYADANDQATWGNKETASMYGGINPRTNSPYTRADPEFAGYTQRGLAGGEAMRIKQDQESGGDSLFGDLGPIAQIAALIPGPQQPFLMAANAANAVSRGDPLGAVLNTVGAVNGFGGMDFSGAGGFNPATDGYGMGDFGGVGESFGGIDSILGDSSYWGAIDSINPNLALETGSAALAAPTSVTNMGLGLQNLAQLGNGPTWNASPWNPESTSLGDTTTSSLGDSNAWKPGSNSLPGYDGAVNTSSYKPDFGTPLDAEQAVQYGAGGGTTGVDAGGYNPMDTLGSTNKFSSYLNTIKGGGMSLKDMLTNPIGGGKGGLMERPSPLSLGVRALGSLDSWSQGKRAQEMLEEQMNRSRGMGDQNAARGSFANNEWMKTQSDPMYGYGSFMQGAGRDFVNNARAAAAKSGNRGGYLNTGRMNSDLASLWQKNQTQRAQSLTGGFASDPYAASNSITPAYANLIKNQNAPLFQGLEGGMKAFQLADLFGGD